MPSARAAKFYEVSKSVIMTSHLVDAIFISIASKSFNAMSPVQQQKVAKPNVVILATGGTIAGSAASKIGRAHV